MEDKDQAFVLLLPLKPTDSEFRFFCGHLQMESGNEEDLQPTKGKRAGRASVDFTDRGAAAEMSGRGNFAFLMTMTFNIVVGNWAYLDLFSLCCM